MKHSVVVKSDEWDQNGIEIKRILILKSNEEFKIDVYGAPEWNILDIST